MSRNPFWTSNTFHIIKLMKAQGNGQGVVAWWIDKARRWAEANAGQDAEALKAWLPHWQARPFYTAQELSPMFPALEIGLNLSRKWNAPKHPTRLRNELIMGDLPRLTNIDGTLEFHGKEYFIVERFGHWRKRLVTIEEFELECGK